MRLFSFLRDGETGVGLHRDDGGFTDLTVLAPKLRGSMRRLLALEAPEQAALLSRARNQGGHGDFASLALLPPVPDASAIWAVALNFATHIDEGKHAQPAQPMLFLRLASSITGHESPLLHPTVTSQFDYEGELAVIVGRGGRHIKAADAMAHVAGYACCNEGSVREWQRHSTQITAGKNFFASGSIGPFLVMRDALPDPYASMLRTRVNGAEVQVTRLDAMLFRIEALIEYVSTIVPLNPGDILLTGTPGGVGCRREPPLFLQPGDEVEVEIDGVGILRNRVELEILA